MLLSIWALVSPETVRVFLALLDGPDLRHRVVVVVDGARRARPVLLRNRVKLLQRGLVYRRLRHYFHTGAC